MSLVSVAAYRLTGMETSPKDTAPFQIARIKSPSRRRFPTLLAAAGESSGEPGSFRRVGPDPPSSGHACGRKGGRSLDEATQTGQAQLVRRDQFGFKFPATSAKPGAGRPVCPRTDRDKGDQHTI